MKKILISGGSGFLGSHLVKYFLDKGDEVYSLARNEYRQWLLLQKNPQVKTILNDVRYFDDESIKPDIIIHAAAMKHVLFSEQNKEEAFSINVDGTANMLEYAHAVGGDFVLISSDKAVEPSNFYGETKAEAERLTCEAGQRVSRWGNFYGSTGSVIEIWFKKLLAGDNTISLHHPDMRRYFVDVDDACLRLDQFLQTDSKTMIYAGAIGWMSDVAKSIFGDDVKIEITEMLKGEKLIERMDYDLDESQFLRYTVDDLREMFYRWAYNERGITFNVG